MEKAGMTTGKFVAGIVIAILVSSAVSIGISTQLIKGSQGPAGATGATGQTGATGATGAKGVTWWNGTGTPTTSLGSDGDFYLDLANGDVYNKVSGLWLIVANIRGAMGAAGVQGPPGPQGPYLPDYDSGWVDITDKAGQGFYLTHNLHSTDIIVDITGKIWPSDAPHQIYLGLSGYVSGFERTYGPGQVGSAVVRTEDGGYAIAGYTYSFGFIDFSLVKIDAVGTVQWNKTYGGTGDDYGYSLIQTSDGGYAMAGSTSSFGAAGGRAYLVKTDAAGNMQWNKTYGAIACWGSSVVQTSDGGYAIAGTISTFPISNWDVYLVKTDAAGNMQWNKTYGVTADNFGYSVVQTSDGGYAIAGYTQPYGYDVYLVKTDTVGTMQWNKTYGLTIEDIGYSVIQTTDGGYAIAGRSGGGVYLVKTDTVGSMLWNKTYAAGTGYSVVQTWDGGYAIGGYTYTGLIDIGDDAYLVKTDGAGTMQWNASSGRKGGDYGCSVVQMDDEGYAMAGYTYPLGSVVAEMYFVKSPAESGLAWMSGADAIWLYRGHTDMYWNYVRVRIWKVGAHEHKVGLVLSSGGLGDKSFNDLSYAGVQKAKDELGIDFDYVQPTAIAQYEGYQRAFAATGDYEIIICVGFDQVDALTIVAAEYPGQKFAIVDAVVDKPNVASLLFRQNEGSFLVGVIAGIKTHSGKIGFVGGMDIPLVRDFFVGYEAGAKWANSTVEVVAPVFVGGWADPTSGKALALGLADLGVDVIYAAAGKSGLGVMEAVHERDILGLGVDACQCYLYPEIIASMTKRVDVAVFEMIKAALEGTFVGGIKSGGLQEQWVGSCRLPEEQPFWEAKFGFTHPFLEATVINKMDEARDKIVAGEIIVPTTL